ncbi:hypothetical protein F7725_000690 [Dissostichus mawsoni]|uniref:DnaJ homolog subfamily C member 22 n=1 Tax=Dissostichus mawsoni TaxID=36200 RepID=A0A7J5ZF49_DISMA|nr:hypothetical protein F7725_000690 [Dissostichus mawsoni]
MNCPGSDPPRPRMAKSVMVAYVLWAMGGPLGLHHVYLGRDSHALLWLLTLGGFGFGWVREFIRIPAYVGEANQDAEKDRKTRPTMVLPPVSPVRFVGQVFVGIYFGTVALIGLNSLSFFYLIVLPLCVGAGVHLVSCIGQQTSDFRKTLTTCLITSPIFYGSSLSPLPISLAASITAASHRRHRPPPPPGSTQKLGPRIYRLGLAWLAFSAPLGYCIFHNTTATLYYLSDCVAALLDMFWFLPWLRNVLSLEIEASLEDITRSYRELAKTWHPDHNPSKDAEAMFVKINEAYEILLRRHKPQRFK